MIFDQIKYFVALLLVLQVPNFDFSCMLQPDRRGNNEEIEDYVIEAERLLALTVVAACTSDNPEIQEIVQNNWSTDISVSQSKFHLYNFHPLEFFFCPCLPWQEWGM